MANQLERKKEEAIMALLSQRNVEGAAWAVNRPVRTLYRWLKEPAFDEAFREARRAAFSQCVARLQQAAPAAVTTLLKTLVDPAAPASVRVRAAECIMNHSIKAIELEDIEGRLSELERTAEETTGKKR